MNRLDLTGLRCPMPLLKTKLALKTLPAGDELEVVADDPGTQKDFPAFIRLSQFQLIDQTIDGDHYIYRIGHKPTDA